jgi:hypothetical protein
MANQKIHEYVVERFSIGDDDYFDIDYYDGAVYTTAKVKGSVIKALAAGLNIYNSDGTLLSDRVVDGDGNTLTFDNLRRLFVNINTAPLGVTAVEFSAVPNGALFSIKDSNTGEERFKVLQNGSVQFNEEYSFPLVDGNPGEVLTTDGAGNVTFQPQTTGDNIYTADGTLTGNRTLTGSNQTLLFQTLGAFIVESHKNNTDNIIFEVRSDAVYHGFIVRDHNTSVHILACRNGAVEISDAYFLPTTPGSNGQVLTTDGAGNTSWESAWKVPNVSLFDAVSSGGLTTAVNAGAGYNRYFNGTGGIGRLHFNIPLKNAGVNYDGSTFQIRLQTQLFGTNVGGNVQFDVSYKFVTANGTTDAETGAVLSSALINVTGRTSARLYDDLIWQSFGPANSDFLMLSIARITGGALNTNIVDAIGITLVKL